MKEHQWYGDTEVEYYRVKFHYFNSVTGFWVWSYEEDVEVVSQWGVSARDNHDAAEDIIKRKYSSAQVTSITYI